MTTRYFAEEPCEHGEVREHLIREVVEKAIAEAAGAPIPPITPCPGGQRRELTGVEVVESVGVTFDEMPEGYDGLILAVPSRGWNGPGRYAIIPLDEPAT